MKDDEIVVVFCNRKTADELGLDDTVTVTTALIEDGIVIAVPRDEFLEWLFEEEDETDRLNELMKALADGKFPKKSLLGKRKEE